MERELEEFIKTKSGVWKIKCSDSGNRYFECKVDGISFTVFEGSNYWEDNARNLDSDIIKLADVLVLVQPGYSPKILDINLLRDESWVKSFIKNIKEEGYHYYLSIWDDRYNLNKFAELTTKGIMYLYD